MEGFWLSIPNIITIIRILLIPVVVSQLYLKQYIWAFVLLFVSGITDVADGYIARKFNMVTKLGTILDPVADKLMQFTVFTCLAVYKLIPVWLVVLLFLKELMMAIGTAILLKKNLVIKANVSGKSATVIFYTTAFVVFLLKWMNFAQVGYVATALCCVAMVSAFYAMGSYAKIFFKLISQKKEF